MEVEPGCRGGGRRRCLEGGGTMRERIRTPGATGVEGAGGAWLQCRRAVAGRGLGTRWRRRKLSQINVARNLRRSFFKCV